MPVLKPKTKVYKIIRNEPVARIARSNLGSCRKYPFETMDVGDMFFVPNRNRNTMTTLVCTTGKRLERKFVSRMVYMRDLGDSQWTTCAPAAVGATLGIGVWRTK